MEHQHSHRHYKGNYKLVILFFLLIYHFALFYSLSLEPVSISDSQEYINSSINYANTGNFYCGEQSENTDYRLFSKRTPLYPLILWLFNKLNLNNNLVFILQILIGLFNIYISIKLIKYITHNYRLPLKLYVLFLLLTPAVFIYGLFIMADIWLQFFVMLCFWFFTEFIKSKHSYWLILLIVSSTLAALTKPVFLYFSIAVSVATMIYFLLKSRHKILFLISFIPILSWYGISKQNQISTGVFHYSSIGYINLLHYNTNLFLSKTIGKTETEKILSPLMMRPESKETYIDNYTKVKTTCIQEIVKMPLKYAIFHLRGVVYFFTDPGRFDIYNFLRLESEDSNGFLHNENKDEKLKSMFIQHPAITVFLILFFVINVIKTIGFVGHLWHHLKNPIVLFGAFMVIYLALLTGPLGASRFALPVQLIIISYAACFYNSILFKKKHAKKLAEESMQQV